jgi:hypothetical protein
MVAPSHLRPAGKGRRLLKLITNRPGGAGRKEPEGAFGTTGSASAPATLAPVGGILKSLHPSIPAIGSAFPRNKRLGFKDRRIQGSDLCGIDWPFREQTNQTMLKEHCRSAVSVCASLLSASRQCQESWNLSLLAGGRIAEPSQWRAQSSVASSSSYRTRSTCTVLLFRATSTSVSPFGLRNSFMCRTSPSMARPLDCMSTDASAPVPSPRSIRP